MITTNDERLAEKLRIYSLHGMSRNAWNRYTAAGSWHYEIEYPGYKYNMTDLQAGLGLAQLHKLERMQARREEIATRYQAAFGAMPELMIPYEVKENRHAWHLYVIRVCLERLKIDRSEFIEALKEEKIGTSVHFIPIYHHPYYQARFNPAEFPVTEEVYQGIISLPLYPKMSDQDVDDVIGAVERVVTKYRS